MQEQAWIQQYALMQSIATVGLDSCDASRYQQQQQWKKHAPDTPPRLIEERY